MKKGFTLVELLGVIAIMAVIMMIAVPVFQGVRERTNQSVYETKIASVQAASEKYATDTGKTVFDIRTLISQGKLEADNESGEYLNPVNGEDMRCYVVSVRYENLQYYANVHETKVCYSEEELESMYGAIQIVAYNATKTDIVSAEYEGWYNEPLFLGYQIMDNEMYTVENLKKISWVGDRNTTCTKEEGNLDHCLYYSDVAIGSDKTITNMNVSFEATFEMDQGVEFISHTSKFISIDLESPKVTSVNVELGTTNKSGKRVEIEMTDGNGSGLLEYKMIKVESASSPMPTCANESGYKLITQSKMVEYKDNGYYYICVKDKVGNDNQDTLAGTKTEVTGVDYSSVDGKTFRIVSSGESTPLKVNATIELNGNEDISKLKMCVSNTGHLQNCSWQNYQSSFTWTLEGNADCESRTVYLSISDEAGNVSHLISNEYSPVDTVNYNANGGSLTNTNDAKKTACYNGNYPTPTATRVGYRFDGWYTLATGGDKITNTTKVNFNGVKTLYAHWTTNTYTISYNANGGNGAPANQTKTRGVALTLSDIIPNRGYYGFISWNTRQDGKGQSFAPGSQFTIDENTTLYAQWEEDRIPPTINCLYKQDNIRKGSIKVKDIVSISDTGPSGLSSVIFYGKNSAPVSLTDSVTTEEGCIQLRAKDKAGNLTIKRCCTGLDNYGPVPPYTLTEVKALALQECDYL